MDRPQVGDQLRARENSSLQVSGGLTLAKRLQNALAAMYTSGQDAKDLHDRAVADLNRDPEEMMPAISAAYGGSPAGDYNLRQALVYAAGVLAHSCAMPFLASVAMSDIPAEASRTPHSFSTVAEETMIRMSAVDGISRRARGGDKLAIELLLKCVKSQSFSIRRAAVTGLMATPEAKTLRPKLEALVPKEQHFIFDLKKVHVSEAIQIKDPTRYLVTSDGDTAEQKPELPHRRPRRGKATIPKTK